MLKNEPSRIYAITEEASTLFLLPVEAGGRLAAGIPKGSTSFLQQYNQRLLELLATVNQLLLPASDERVYDFLKNQARDEGDRPGQPAPPANSWNLNGPEVIDPGHPEAGSREKLRQTEAGIEIL